MSSVFESMEEWRAQGKQIAIATVIKTWGSSPCPVGSKLITTPAGDIAGSVSAGCVEGAVIDACLEALETGIPQLLTFGVADETAWDVGLACGGTIQVFVEPFTAWEAIYPDVQRHLKQRESMAVVSALPGTAANPVSKLIVLPDGSTEGSLSANTNIKDVIGYAVDLLAKGNGGTLELDNQTTLFVDVYPPTPRLLIVGAVHIAEALVTMANAAGFETIVLDPRGAFATEERFPHATQLIKKYPHLVLTDLKLDDSAYLVILTHDPKIDDATLQLALRSKARYIGALGSRRTNEKRLDRLRNAGLTDDELARLHAPIGLHLGGNTPHEIAVSILAEIVKVKNSSPQLGVS